MKNAFLNKNHVEGLFKQKFVIFSSFLKVNFVGICIIFMTLIVFMCLLFEFFILYPCILLYAYHKDEPRVFWNYMGSNVTLYVKSVYSLIYK